MMNEGPKDYRLFHYTRKKKHLLAMLRDGIWPRFSEEEFTWLGGRSDSEYFIAFPIASFCDIPIAAARDHRRKYGHYAIAVHKIYAEDLDITPVWYIRDDGSYADALRQRFPRGARFTLRGAKHCDLFPFLPLLKITVGTQPDRRSKGSESPEGIAFDEECEWRIVSTVPSSDHWRESYQRGFVSESDHQQSARAKVKLKPEMIAAVFVRTARDVIDLRRIFRRTCPSLCRKIRLWPKRK